MFGLHRYLDKIYNIKWYMTPEQKDALQQYMCVTFEGENDYYIIKEIHYTYVDILIALADIDFEFSKQNEEYALRIVKI